MRHHSIARLPGRAGWWLALMALAMQLAAAVAAPWPAAAASADPLLSAPICHSGPDAGTPHPGPATPQHHACLVCPLCAAMAQAPFGLAPADLTLPLPRHASASPALPPARAAPLRRATFNPPSTGPPALV